MQTEDTAIEVLAVKDEENERPIPFAWRPVFREIVAALVNRDYHVSTGGALGVAPISNATAAQIRNYIEEYGETLIELPDATWESSVCVWMGSRWNVLIDLWTIAEGRSDLVLQADVWESEAGFTFKIHMVYVP